MSHFQQYQTDLSARLAARAADRIMISGCSGGGKSSLIAELARRGHRVFEEPGRQIVREQELIGGPGLPWSDLGHFVELTVSRSLFFALESLHCNGRSFFDRGPIDQVSALEAQGVAVPAHLEKAADMVGYGRVFLVPPWPDIYRTDAERRHGFPEAEAAYHHLVEAYRRRGYNPVILPLIAVTQRADFVLDNI